MDSVLVLFVAAIVGAIGYQYFKKMDFVVGSSASARLERFAAADKRSMTDRFGDSLMDRLGLTLDAWEHELFWAQTGDYYAGKTVGSVLGRSIFFAGIGLAYMLTLGNFSAVFMGAVCFAAYYPFMQLRSKGQIVRADVKRGLPEAAALVAAEMAAGSSAETAIQRAASMPGALETMIQRAIAEATQGRRLVFSRGAINGVLVEHFAKYRMPEVESFARQLDLVASTGADGPKQMGEVARGLAREYRSDVSREAEKLDNKLAGPVMLFIFFPLLLTILVPLFGSVFQTL
jgi:tight adherence protein C